MGFTLYPCIIIPRGQTKGGMTIDRVIDVVYVANHNLTKQALLSFLFKEWGHALPTAEPFA